MDAGGWAVLIIIIAVIFCGGGIALYCVGIMGKQMEKTTDTFNEQMKNTGETLTVNMKDVKPASFAKGVAKPLNTGSKNTRSSQWDI